MENGSRWKRRRRGESVIDVGNRDEKGGGGGGYVDEGRCRFDGYLSYTSICTYIGS